MSLFFNNGSLQGRTFLAVGAWRFKGLPVTSSRQCSIIEAQLASARERYMWPFTPSSQVTFQEQVDFMIGILTTSWSGFVLRDCCFNENVYQLLAARKALVH